MRKILLTGKNGQVGWELRRSLAPWGRVLAVDRREMNLADLDSVRKTIREIQPDLIVNAAAYTSVDRAESEPDLAMRINGEAPGVMAEEAKRLKAAIVHYSTDYVFDGSTPRSYEENDAPKPLNVYGKTKLAGEQAVQAAGVPCLILRTSWVYGGRGKNFLLTVLRLARERTELKIVDDQAGAPTWSRMLAEATSQMLARHFLPGQSRLDSMAGFTGLYHVTSGGTTTWYGFAGKILEKCPRSMLRDAPKLVPISTAEYPLPAARPRNSRLSNEKLLRNYGLAMPSWEDALEMCLEEMAEKISAGA